MQFTTVDLPRDPSYWFQWLNLLSTSSFQKLVLYWQQQNWNTSIFWNWKCSMYIAHSRLMWCDHATIAISYLINVMFCVDDQLRHTNEWLRSSRLVRGRPMTSANCMMIDAVPSGRNATFFFCCYSISLSERNGQRDETVSTESNERSLSC